MRWYAEYAWLGGPGPTAGVLIEAEAGRFTTVTAGVAPPPGVPRLAGVTLPGLADTHSHAFHRALRGRTHDDRGSFWTWRDRMYAVADRLDPDSYLALARAVYAELASTGVTCVGEFHYLHHDRQGRRYAEENVMADALAQAAADAGIRITLLDTCYLAADVDGAPLTGVQRRFGDADAAAWAQRTQAWKPSGNHVRAGVAIHSVRAVPAAELPVVAQAATSRGAPLHVHLSEQPAENAACLARHGRTPTALLADAGALGTATTAVHATHLTDADVALLAETGTGVCLCPTTERDLADGIGPAGPLAAAWVALSLGSDSHAVVDLFEEARAVEAHERLRTGRRGHFSPAELLAMASQVGHRALGWPDAGRIAVGERADLVTVRCDSVRTAGVDPAGLIFAATAADVTDVVVDGRPVVADGRHLHVDVPAELAAAIRAVAG